MRGKLWATSTLLTLFLAAGGCQVWRRTAMRTRPWLLESYVSILEAECRTGWGANALVPELRALSARINEAGDCLTEANESWVARRDYTPCVARLLDAAADALRIRLNQDARRRDAETRLEYYLKTLELEGTGSAVTTPAGTRLQMSNLAQSRARTRLEQARNLERLGQLDSALNAVLSAQAAWGQGREDQAAELARFHDPGLKAAWEADVQNLLKWTAQTGRSAILVDKLEHRCHLVTSARIEKSYPANLGRNWYRNKVKEHDASTPEGEYTIRRKFRSNSFGWALLLDYPNAEDRARFRSLKNAGEVDPAARIGGSIEIHGSGRLDSDWTDGCVSLKDADMEELYRRAYSGMPVTIVGTTALSASYKD